MDWMIKVFFCILINGIVGSMAFWGWRVWSKKLETQRRYMQNYMMLKLVIAFYLFPAPLLFAIVTPVRRLLTVYVWIFFKNHGWTEHAVLALIGVWIAGICCAAFFYLKECWAVRRIVRHNEELKDPVQTGCFENICLRRRFYRPVEVYENALVSTPMIVRKGFRDLILFPNIIYNDREFEIILEHEIIHAKHRDLFSKKILTWMKIILWFFPSVTGMLKALGDWSETACDVVMCGESDAVWSKKQYFEPMLNHLPVNAVSLNSALALNTNQLELMTRMQRMKVYGIHADAGKMRLMYKFPVSIMASVALFAAALAGIEQVGNLVCISVAEYRSGEISPLGSTLIPKKSMKVGAGETVHSRFVYVQEGQTVKFSSEFYSGNPDCYSAIVSLEDRAGNRFAGEFIGTGLDEVIWNITESGYYRVTFYNEFELPFRITWQVTGY